MSFSSVPNLNDQQLLGELLSKWKWKKQYYFEYSMLPVPPWVLDTRFSLFVAVRGSIMMYTVYTPAAPTLMFSQLGLDTG